MKNNLVVNNTGLDHIYINGVPIVEAELDMDDIINRVSRSTSLAVQTDPYFNDKSSAQKLLSEIHTSGSRIITDFLKDAVDDILPVFLPLQRLIPEGVYDTKSSIIETLSQSGDFSWTNPNYGNLFINSIRVKWISGYGDLTFFVDGIELGTITLPKDITVNEYLAYDLSGFLGGYSTHEFSHNENVRSLNSIGVISIVVSNEDSLVYDVQLMADEYDAIGWNKAVLDNGTIAVPALPDSIRIPYLRSSFTWNNIYSVKVTGVLIRRISGEAYVKIDYNDVEGEMHLMDTESYGFALTGDISSIVSTIYYASDDFTYDLIINTELPKEIPSPRVEFDSSWNPGKVIFRWQFIDNRRSDMKLDYTVSTLGNIRVDKNTLDHVKSFLSKAIESYILQEFYYEIGYDKKYMKSKRDYIQNRQQVAYWAKSDTGLKTQYSYGG